MDKQWLTMATIRYTEEELTYYDKTILQVFRKIKRKVTKDELVKLLERAFPHIKYPPSTVQDIIQRLWEIGLVEKIYETEKEKKRRGAPRGRCPVYWKAIIRLEEPASIFKENVLQDILNEYS